MWLNLHRRTTCQEHLYATTVWLVSRRRESDLAILKLYFISTPIITLQVDSHWEKKLGLNQVTDLLSCFPLWNWNHNNPRQILPSHLPLEKRNRGNPVPLENAFILICSPPPPTPGLLQLTANKRNTNYYLLQYKWEHMTSLQ